MSSIFHKVYDVYAVKRWHKLWKVNYWSLALMYIPGFVLYNFYVNSVDQSENKTNAIFPQKKHSN